MPTPTASATGRVASGRAVTALAVTGRVATGLVVAAFAVAAVVSTATQFGVLGAAVVALALAAAAWWVLARDRFPRALRACSFAAAGLAAGFVAEPRWQLAPWQAAAALAAAGAVWRVRRPHRSRRWSRVAHRTVLTGLVLVGTVAVQFAAAPRLPAPSGPLHVGAEIFNWTDTSRSETLTADPADHREVVAQAWYPSDTTNGRPAGYLATGGPAAVIDGLPTWFFGGYDEIDTHAYLETPVSAQRARWPILVFSPGLNVARQSNTALAVELASRGYVVLALSHPYDSAATGLSDGRVVGPATAVTPDDFSQLPQLIRIRAADVSFALDQLQTLQLSQPDSPLVGRLDFDHVGVFGHSTGGATAVAVTAADDRFDAGANLDGRLFGDVPRLDTPLLWVEDASSAEPGHFNALMRQSRDQLLGGLRAGGGLVTIEGITHLSFTDEPAYLTPTGRRMLGRSPMIGVGSQSVDDLAPLLADIVTGFMGPYLDGADNGDLAKVDARHDPVRVRLIPIARG